jgi:hypothetical protein
MHLRRHLDFGQAFYAVRMALCGDDAFVSTEKLMALFSVYGSVIEATKSNRRYLFSFKFDLPFSPSHRNIEFVLNLR